MIIANLKTGAKSCKIHVCVCVCNMYDTTNMWYDDRFAWDLYLVNASPSIRHLWEPLVVQSATVVWGGGCTGAGRDLLCCACCRLPLLQPPDITETVGERAGRSAVEKWKTYAESQLNAPGSHKKLSVTQFFILPLWISTGVCRGSVGGWCKERGPPSLPQYPNTKSPWDPIALHPQSLDHSATTARDQLHWCLTYLLFIIK